MSNMRTCLHDLPKLENAQQLSNNNGLIIALFSFVYFLVSIKKKLWPKLDCKYAAFSFIVSA